MKRIALSLIWILMMTSVCMSQTYYSATVTSSNVKSTTRVILVDLSNTTDYPHTNTNNIDLETLSISADVSGQSDWLIRIGHVGVADGDTGTVYWAMTCYLNRDEVASFNWDFEGSLVGSLTDDAPDRYTTNSTSTGSAWSTAISLRDAAGNADAAVGAGDLVAEIVPRVSSVIAKNVNITIRAGYASP